jgi:hypothetical protein
MASLWRRLALQWLAGNGSGMLTAEPVFIDFAYGRATRDADPIAVRREGEASRNAPSIQSGRPARAHYVPALQQATKR